MFERHEEMFRPLNGIGLPLQLDPALARCGFHPQFGIQRLKVAGIVIEKLLGDAGVFEVKGF
jgi:hypothetical protein